MILQNRLGMAIRSWNCNSFRGDMGGRNHRDGVIRGLSVMKSTKSYSDCRFRYYMLTKPSSCIRNFHLQDRL